MGLEAEVIYYRCRYTARPGVIHTCTLEDYEREAKAALNIATFMLLNNGELILFSCQTKHAEKREGG